MKARMLTLLVAGALSVSAWATSAEAIDVNGTGASAGTPFGSFVPLVLCDQSPIPVHYQNGTWTGGSTFASRTQHVWVCNRNSTPHLYRYHGTRSSDGITKVKPDFNTAGAAAVQLDLTPANLANCTGPVTLTIGGRTYEEISNCTNTTSVTFPTHYGFSDVRGSSFHQSGPSGSFINPIDEGTLVRATAAITPFDIVLGNGVVQPTTSNTVAGPVQTLSRLEVEGLLSRGVLDWRQLGLATCAPSGGVMCAPGSALDASSPADLCLRNSGSGTKAALDETVLKDAIEKGGGLGTFTLPNTVQAHGVFFGGSNNNIRDCIKGAANFSLAHPNAIGYMEADQAFAGATTGTPGMYIVKMNGYRANDTALANPKCHIIAGRHYYWTNQNMYKRPAPAVGIDASTQTAIDDYFTNAALPSTVLALPAGAFWIDETSMNVSKNADAGPVAWKSLPLPTTCN